MKTVLRYIFEASGKPSDIKKFVEKNKVKRVKFNVGDVYDKYDGYYDDISYYDAKGQGYIKDKAGNTYDVEVYKWQDDAGRIVGGSTHYAVVIKKANGKDDFEVEGRVAIMSKAINDKCINDIKAGYYLEDYMAKYIRDNHDKSFQEIAAKGDKNAKSWEGHKEDKKADKYREFMTRYFLIPEKVNWEITNNGLEITGWEPARQKPTDKVYSDEMIEKIKNDPELRKQIQQENAEQKNKINTIVLDIFKPIVTNIISKVFKTKDINKLKGLGGNIVYEREWTMLKKGVQGEHVFVVDTKEKKLAKAVTGKWGNSTAKIVDGNVELQIADNIKVNKSLLSPELEKLIRTVATAWKKANKGKQGEYIEKNWRRVQDENSGIVHKLSDKDAKAKTKDEYKDMIEKHDFDKNDNLEFSLSLILLYVQGDFDPDQAPVEKPLENPEPSNEKKERGKNTQMNDKSYQAAKQKMQDWHDGKRKQNVANCSDAKLKMNYKVCKELGLDKEMAELKKEADKRGIVLESISLAEMVKAINESED